MDQICPKVWQLSVLIFHSDPAGSVPSQMDKACYDTFETYDTDSEYDGKNPNKTVGQANTSNLEKCFDIDYLKHDFIKAPKPAVPVTTEKNTLNKKVQKFSQLGTLQNQHFLCSSSKFSWLLLLQLWFFFFLEEHA